MPPTFETLPAEVRCRIYTLLFRGKNLWWARYLNRYGWQIAQFLSVRFVSKLCFKESDSIFYKEVQIDITDLIDDYYACLYPSIDLNLFDNVRIVFDPAQSSVVSILRRMFNLKRLTVRVYDDTGDAPAYEFFNDDSVDGRLSQFMKDFIQTYPGRVLGVDDEHGIQTASDLSSELRNVIDIWKERNKSFELCAEMEVLTETKPRRWTGSVDLSTKVLKVVPNIEPFLVTVLSLDKLSY